MEATDLHAVDYSTLIATVILYYDYLLCFGLEYERFWKRPKMTVGFWLFFLVRYVSLLGHIPVMAQNFVTFPLLGDSKTTCDILARYHSYFSLVVQCIVEVILILRVYIMYTHDRRLLAIFVSLSIGGIVTACWSIMHTESLQHSDVGLHFRCIELLFKSQQQGIRLAASWSWLLLIDMLVFGMTLRKALMIRRALGPGCTLWNVLLRDGSLYFGVIVLSTLATILGFLLGGPRLKGLLSVITNTLSSALVSRLMLNLRDSTLSALPTAIIYPRLPNRSPISI